MLENIYENKLSKSYLSNGYVIEESNEKKTLNDIKSIFIKNINKLLLIPKVKKDDYILNYLHKFIGVKDLNSLGWK